MHIKYLLLTIITVVSAASINDKPNQEVLRNKVSGGTVIVINNLGKYHALKVQKTLEKVLHSYAISLHVEHALKMIIIARIVKYI